MLKKQNFKKKLFIFILLIIYFLFNFSCTTPIIPGIKSKDDKDNVKIDDKYDLTIPDDLKTALKDEEYINSVLSRAIETAGISDDFMYGDVNGDGLVDNTDAILVCRYYVGLSDPAFIHPDAADTDDDGRITVADTFLIAQYFEGIIDSFPAELNYFSNPHFHAGDKDWGYFQQEGGDGTTDIVDGELKVSINNGGTLLWSVGVCQIGLNLEEEKSYLFKFKARTGEANTNLIVRPIFQLNGEPWYNYYDKRIVLTDQMKTYSMVFKSRVTDPEVNFNFHLGTSNVGEIYIDDVCLYEVNPDETPVILANPYATENAQRVYEYISSLSTDNFNGVISGQNCYHGNEITSTSELDGYNSLVEELYNQTGKWVGMIGIDYEYVKIFTLDELSQANQVLIDYWNNGGLITINWSPQNPWINDESDIVGNPGTWDGPGCPSDLSNVDLNELVDPSTEVYQVWRKKLDRIATALAELQDAGVVVLWRPLQEYNLSWCWWGMESHPYEATPYMNLYIDMYNYFTYEKKLNNLIWVLSPAAVDNETAINDIGVEKVTACYPGDGYVDIVAATSYNDELTINSYEELVSIGKPLGMGEYGPTLWGDLTYNGTFDTTVYINRIRNDYPRIAYWVSWHSYPNECWSIISNQNYYELLNDVGVLTRENINW